jgi:hypothetical protein
VATSTYNAMINALLLAAAMFHTCLSSTCARASCLVVHLCRHWSAHWCLETCARSVSFHSLCDIQGRCCGGIPDMDAYRHSSSSNCGISEYSQTGTAHATSNPFSALLKHFSDDLLKHFSDDLLKHFQMTCSSTCQMTCSSTFQMTCSSKLRFEFACGLNFNAWKRVLNT